MASDLVALAVEPIAYLVASIRQLTTTFPSGWTLATFEVVLC